MMRVDVRFLVTLPVVAAFLFSCAGPLPVLVDEPAPVGEAHPPASG